MSSLLVAAAMVSPAPQAFAVTGCSAGTPADSDLDGDGHPDFLLSTGDGIRPTPTPTGPDFEWKPGSQGGTVTVSRPATFADLNGDTCMDLVISGAGVSDSRAGTTAEPSTIRTYLGSSAGPVKKVVAEGSKLFTAGTSLASTTWWDYSIAFSEHDGLKQVLVAGVLADYATELTDPAVYVFTLDSDRTSASSARISLRDAGASQFSSPSGLGSDIAVTADDGVVAVGVRLQTVDTLAYAGAVHVFEPDSGDPDDLVHRATITQNSPGVPGTAEASDGFGSTVALRDGRLAIGAPGEGVSGHPGAGLVQRVLWNKTTHTYTALPALTQGSPGVPGANEDEDHFGSALSVGRGFTSAGSYDVVIGVPSESVGSRLGVGRVVVSNFTKPIYKQYRQGVDGVPGGGELADYFGWSVTTVRAASGAESLVVLSSGERWPSCGSSKYGLITGSSAGPLTADTTWSNLRSPCQIGRSRGLHFAWSL